MITSRGGVRDIPNSVENKGFSPNFFVLPFRFARKLNPRGQSWLPVSISFPDLYRFFANHVFGADSERAFN